MSVLTIVLVVGLTARLTRLVARDVIAARIRVQVLRWFGDRQVYYLVTCSWCLSVWVGAAVATVGWFYGDTPAFIIVAVAGIASYLTGVGATFLEPEAGNGTVRK